MKDLYLNSIAKQLNLTKGIVNNVVELYYEGATIPFIARYRKEQTQQQNEEVIKQIFEKIEYFDTLEDRKETIISTIEKLDKLTDALKEKIEKCIDKTELEDLYIPFKPKKQTKATIAKSYGLEEISNKILNQENVDIDKELSKFINKDTLLTLDDVKLNVVYIIAEKIAENSEVLAKVRDFYYKNGFVQSKLKRGQKEEEAIKYKDYFDTKEECSKIPSHRFLAINRGDDEGFLSLSIVVNEEAIVQKIFLDIVDLKTKQATKDFIKYAIDYCVKNNLHNSISTFTKNKLKDEADLKAIDIFKKNATQILLAPPVLNKNILGVDPGYRTGCKLAVIDQNGKFICSDVMYPVEPHNKTKESEEKVLNLINKYNIKGVAIGNGTASKETTSFIKKVKENNKLDFEVIITSESGASIYSASEIAQNEFPDLDLTIRSAISIARRVLDPLSELVKIDPKSIGVGEYQYDVNQKMLNEALTFTVSSIVNKVGVNLNVASHKLLSYVSGLNEKTAKNIVSFREKNGKYKTREDLLKVNGVGEKTFEQSAGFLIINDGTDYFDSTRIHPESYETARIIFDKMNIKTEEFFKKDEKEKDAFLKKVNKKEIEKLSDKGFFTIEDMFEELLKPSRDPRMVFAYANFSPLINDFDDLREEMILEGVVTNITNFGAFIDIGLHESGLVHISEISKRRINSVHEVLNINDIVRVKVKKVDKVRKRIELSIKDAVIELF